MIELKVVVGTDTIATCSGEDLKAVIEDASFFSSLPKKCPLCESALGFQVRRPKGFVYYGLVCHGRTPHEINFGVAKEGGRLYYSIEKGWKEVGAWQDEDDDDRPAKTPPPARRIGLHPGPGPCPQCHCPEGKPHATNCTA